MDRRTTLAYLGTSLFADWTKAASVLDEQSADSASEDGELPYLDTPEGFRITVFADAEELGGGPFGPGPQPGPRMLETYRGTLYATVPGEGRVVALPQDGDGSASGVETVVEDLTKPHGIAFHDDQLYLALAGSIVRYRMEDSRPLASSKTVLVDDVPLGNTHWTRSLAVRESNLYLSAGACITGECSGGNQEYLAAVTEFDLDGSDPTPYATGLRNAVGIEWHDDELFVTENAREGLGPDLPPDQIHVLERGRDYGYPECYTHGVPVDDEDEDACEGSPPAAATLGAHVAPLGFAFNDAESIREAYRGDMYVSFHGSWELDDPVGYEVVRVPHRDGTLGEPEEFVTGWMPSDGGGEDARGRPVDVHATEDGTMYVTDDLSGRIYRISHDG